MKEAVVSIDNIEFGYGYGVYENLRVRKGLLYFPELHVKRLLASAKIIGIKTDLTEQEIKESVEELMATVDGSTFNIKMLLMGKGDSSDLYIFALSPFFMPKKVYRDGVKTVLVNYEREFHDAKSLSMLGSFLAYKKAKEKGAYDALLIDRSGFVREGTRTNLFYTDGEKIYTTPKDQVLDGVTRKTVIYALKQKGIPVIEKVLRKDDICRYKGFFITSTSSKILPVSVIDDNKFYVPEIIRQSVKIYDDYLEDYRKRMLENGTKDH